MEEWQRNSLDHTAAAAVLGREAVCIEDEPPAYDSSHDQHSNIDTGLRGNGRCEDEITHM